MYTGKKAFMGSLEYHALSQQNKRFFSFLNNNNNKKNYLFSFSGSLFPCTHYCLSLPHVTQQPQQHLCFIYFFIFIRNIPKHINYHEIS